MNFRDNETYRALAGLSHTRRTAMRYYFNVRDDEALERDPEGAEFDSLEAAYDEAVQAAREILAGRLMRGETINREVFEITTESGEIVGLVPFKATIKF
jgi:hypothetical protein